MKLSITQRAVIALCIVSLCYSLLSVVVRLMNTGFGPFTQVYLRIGFGCLLSCAFFYKKIRFKKFSKISQKDWFYLLLMGTFGYGLAVDFITLGTIQTKLLDVAVISSTTPFFVFLFTTLILRKPFHKYLLVFLIMAFYGVCVLATKSFLPAFSAFGIGDFNILLFAIGFGFYILGRKMLSPFLNNFEIAVLVMFIAFLSSLLMAIILREPLTPGGFLNPYAVVGLVLGGILNLLATTLETFGFKYLNAVAGSQIMLLENVFTPFFGFVFYREIILPVEFFGALFVILGVWFYIKHTGD